MFDMTKDNLFNSWKNVQKEYEMDLPEPDKILCAFYTYEDYSGDSVVVYQNNNKYYLNTGDHCSCNGLEGQWAPTEYPDLETLKAALSLNSEANRIILEAIQISEFEHAVRTGKLNPEADE